MTAALTLRCLRELTLRRATHTPGQRHLSAASGLVCAHGHVYAMGDDEHHLAWFDDAATPGRALRLFDGDLPSGKKTRKRRKPDAETLALLPSGRELLALGSGSKDRRCRAVVVALNARGTPRRSPAPIDLAPLYAPLRRRFGDLNIEGAFFAGSEFVLLQRGHRGGAPNASIRYRADETLAWLAGQRREPEPVAVREHRLPRTDGVALTFTDGAALADGGWLFTAVAEATDDSVADGACVASAVGRVSARGALQQLWLLPDRAKVEGIAVLERGRGGVDIALVTDADDPAVPSRLLVGRLSARR